MLKWLLLVNTPDDVVLCGEESKWQISPAKAAARSLVRQLDSSSAIGDVYSRKGKLPQMGGDSLAYRQKCGSNQKPLCVASAS